MASRADISAGRAYVRLFLKNDLTGPLAKTLSSAGKGMQSMGRQAAAAGAGLTGMGAAILAPFAASIKHFAAFGDQLDKMSQRTGIAAPALAELGFAAEQSGTDLAKVENAVRKMQKTIGDADRGLSTAVDALDALGLSAAALEGMTPEDQFQAIADRVGAIEDPTKKAAAAMEVFGSRTGTALLPMLDGLADLRQEARDLGIVPTAKAVADAAKVTDAINRIKRSVMGTAFEIGASLADSVLAFAGAMQKAIRLVGLWVRDNAGLIKVIAAVGIGLVAAGTALVAFGTAAMVMGAALSGLATIVSTVGAAIGLLFTPLGLVAAALVGGIVLWARYTSSGQAAIGKLKTVFGTLLGTVREVFGGIMDAIATGDIATAGAIAFTGLKLVALQSLDALKGIVGEAVAGIVGKLASGDISGAWTDTVKQLSALWAVWSEGVVKTFTGMAAAITGVWSQVTSFIADKILEVASLPGFNTLFEKFSGVDIRAEIARGKKLGVKDPLADAQKNAADDISGQADDMIAALERVNQAAEAATKSASSAAVAAAKEGMAAVSPLIAETQAALDALTKKAAENRAKADAKRKADKEKEKGVDGKELGSQTQVATFSAAAAVAMSFGQQAAPKSDNEKNRKILEKTVAVQKEILAATKETNTELGRFINGMAFR